MNSSRNWIAASKNTAEIPPVEPPGTRPNKESLAGPRWNWFSSFRRRYIQTAFNRYEDAQEGRGALFMFHLDAAFTHLSAFPEIGPLFRGKFRRLLVPRYPYGIFYALEQNRIVVCTVM